MSQRKKIITILNFWILLMVFRSQQLFAQSDSEDIGGHRIQLYGKAESTDVDKNSFSVNLMYLANREVGFIYTREFYDSGVALVIPYGFGYQDPHFTQEVYFSGSLVTVHRKIFETGAGINFYVGNFDSARYYIGPMMRIMQYYANQETGIYGKYASSTILTRGAFTITNGLNFKGKSGITSDVFVSLGVKSDALRDPLIDGSGTAVQSIPKPISLYIWTGFIVGFGF